MKISIIVPTYNSEVNITNFLESCLKSTFKDFEVIINDDKRTDDKTEQVVSQYKNKGLVITYLRENKMMAQARKQGAKYAKGDILIHLDSDMSISPELLGECIYLIDSGFDALVIPEEAYGTTFWAKCKWLEKKMYEGVSEIESLRVIKKSVYNEVGGHDENMVFSEDKDFDLRVREGGFGVGRTKNTIGHNEGELRLFKTSKKKMGYSNTANVFAKRHPEHYKWQINILNRYLIYIKNIRYLFIHPLLYLGLYIMKTSEFFFGALGIIKKKILK